MSLILRQDPLQTLSYVLFELTGEKLYEIFHFVTRNPYVTRVIRQVRDLRCGSRSSCSSGYIDQKPKNAWGGR